MTTQAPIRIPQCDPRAGFLEQAAEIESACHQVLHAGHYILGSEVAAFEQEFAAFCGTPHATGVANGTDALSLALRALGVGAGDAVVTVSLSAVATAAAIRAVGAHPLFVDVDADIGVMDPDSARELLSRAASGRLAVKADRIKAIVPVHLYGRCADMPAILDLAREFDLAVVEDCAQAHGATRDGRTAGTFGAIGCFSFYPTKNLGAMGDGGAVVTSDASLDGNVRLLRQYGWRQRYISDIEGTNSRLDELQAAILRIRLRRLSQDNTARRSLAAIYQSAITAADVVVPPADPGHAYHQFVIRHPARDALQTHLREQGIGTLVHYPKAIHQQPAYSGAELSPLPLPHTERWAAEVLSLPMYPQLAAGDARAVADAINAWDRS